MIIAPSVLSLDYGYFQQQIQQVNQSQAKWLHFDVMDGHFVPNLTFGPDILKAFCRHSLLVKDVHLMVSDPAFFADVFIKAGAQVITFHLEAVNPQQTMALIQQIHQQNVKVGISIKPNTPVEQIEPYLSFIDLVLVMSVEPGFGGQAFMENSLEKIAYLRKMIDEHHYAVQIEVDGGINQETGQKCVTAGADILVAGSYIFKGDIQERVASLCNLKP